jgi:hypothetical protein
MKKPSILLAILALTLCCGAAQVFAQEKAKPTQIILELFVQDKYADTHIIPVNVNKIGAADVSGGGVAKDYGPNYDVKTEGLLGPGYSYKWKAVVINKNQTRITLSVKIEDGEDINRKVKKTFIVTNNQPTKLQLNYRINLVAYYGSKEEEPN